MRAALKTMSSACLYTFLCASLRTSCTPSYSFSYVPCTKLRPSDPLQLTPLTHSSVRFGTGPRCVASVAMQFVQWCSRPTFPWSRRCPSLSVLKRLYIRLNFRDCVEFSVQRLNGRREVYGLLVCDASLKPAVCTSLAFSAVRTASVYQPVGSPYLKIR